jgi:serine/threonine protein kinase
MLRRGFPHPRHGVFAYAGSVVSPTLIPVQVSERFIRCAHCGLPHDAHVAVCPTTGLRIDRHERVRKRRTLKASPDRAAEQRRMVGRIIDQKYRVIAAIGEGGMSSIYESEHLGLDRRVAIKVLHPSLADDPEAVARLRHEAKVVSTIGHPNICEVLDLGRTANGSPYLVMELLVGESLAERIKDVGAIPFNELAPLMKQVLRALDAAHDKGILHRDLKPENVFIEEERNTGAPSAKLLDFGISKSMSYDFIENQRLTHTGMVMGTPYYMAPEQARGDSGLDQRVDLWAIGVMMYEALTGRRPFVATNYNALLVKILTSRPRQVSKIDPLIPADAAAIIDRALSKLREDRYQTARQMIDAISKVQRKVAGEDPHAPTMMMRRRTRRDPEQTIPNGPAPKSERDWHHAIDDPRTFIDDDVDYDQSVALPPPKGQPLPLATATWDDGYPDPIEPTIQDRALYEDWEQSEPIEPDQRTTLTDEAAPTDVINRGKLNQRSPVSGGGGTEVIDTGNLFKRAEMRKATREASVRPLPPPTKRSEPPPPPKRKKTGRNQPRPSAVEDDEKTTLYDIDAAKKKLAARKKK